MMLLTAAQIGCSVFGIRSEENPKYEVLVRHDNMEVRRYESYLAAATSVTGEFKEAQGTAFRILADYIFGNNQGKEEISMTAPVVQERRGGSEKIAMTAPVVQAPSGEGWTMSFMMPSKYRIEDLPAPNDPRVRIERVPTKLAAAITYSGLGRESANREMARELRAWLEGSSRYEIVSGPSYAGFDPPWTIPFLRKNEMMFEVKEKD